MKKIVFLAGILFCIYSCKITEKVPVGEKEYLLRTYNLPDSLTYQLLEVINPIIYEMLDSVLELSKTCLFIRHEQPYRYTFRSYSLNDTATFFCSVEQYDHLFYWSTYYDSLFSRDKFCFIYKDVWFTGNVFPYDSESDYFSDYFKLADQEKKLNICFPNKEIYYYKSDHPVFYLSYFADFAGVRYDFHNNAIMHIDGRSCENIDVIYHTVKRRETLKELAEKYNTTEKHIRTLNPQMSLATDLSVGKKIRVQ